MKRILPIICFAFILSILCTSISAATPIDPERPSSLTLYYQNGGKGLAGLEIRIYRIAEVRPSLTYTLTGDFKNYPVNIYGITSQTEWRNVASTLAAYIDSDGISPTYTQVTDGEGRVSFTNILPGMYLTLGVKRATAEKVVTFETFLTVVPYPDDNGNHNYDVVAYPKSDVYVPEKDEIEYKVMKLWSDSGNEDKRPASVTVDVFKDGMYQFSQKLSSKNYWEFRWTAPDDGGNWQAMERGAGENYAVTVIKRGTSIIIINDFLKAPPEDPDDPADPEDPEDPIDPEDPEDPEDPVDPEDPEDPDNPDSPGTSDDSNIWTYTAILSLLLGGLTVVWNKKRA